MEQQLLVKYNKQRDEPHSPQLLGNIQLRSFLLTFLNKNGTMLYNGEAYHIANLFTTTIKRLVCIISRADIMMRRLVDLLMGIAKSVSISVYNHILFIAIAEMIRFSE